MFIDIQPSRLRQGIGIRPTALRKGQRLKRKTSLIATGGFHRCTVSSHDKPDPAHYAPANEKKIRELQPGRAAVTVTVSHVTSDVWTWLTPVLLWMQINEPKRSLKNEPFSVKASVWPNSQLSSPLCFTKTTFSFYSKLQWSNKIHCI